VRRARSRHPIIFYVRHYCFYYYLECCYYHYSAAAFVRLCPCAKQCKYYENVLKIRHVRAALTTAVTIGHVFNFPWPFIITGRRRGTAICGKTRGKKYNIIPYNNNNNNTDFRLVLSGFGDKELTEKLRSCRRVERAGRRGEERDERDRFSSAVSFGCPGQTMRRRRRRDRHTGWVSE